MRRAAPAAAAALAALVLSGAALAANSGSIAVWHTPMLLAGSQSTTIHLFIPRTTDPVAAIAVFVPAGYTLNLAQPPGRSIGEVTATALAHDTGLTLPLGGTVVTDDPALHAAGSSVCAGTPASAAVWILELAVAGQSLELPVYVNPTAGAEQALGAYKLSVCLPPWDVPAGTPGRSVQGAQVLDATFTVAGVFRTPAGGGLLRWESLFTPYTPGTGTANTAGTFEARAFVPLPIVVGLHVAYARTTGTWTLSGRISEGGVAAVGPTLVSILRGATAHGVEKIRSVRAKADGSWRATGRLLPPRTTYFQVGVAKKERDYTAKGCRSPLPASLAPGGCVRATLSPWSAKSVLIRLRP